MSVLTDIWRQMVRRRLWPVALLLAAALAAVPLLLAKDPEPVVEAAPPVAAPSAETIDLAEASIVKASGTSTRTPGRNVLGKQRDIFKSTEKKPKAAKPDATPEPETPDQPSQSSPPADTGGSGGAPSTGGGDTVDPAPATPAEPAPKPKTYPQYSLKVRFTGAEAQQGYLPRRAALPSTDNPLIVYLGLLDDKKTAVFLVDSTVQAVGDGACHPTPESCETVRMQEGDTMFFDVVDATGNPAGEQYQLDLIDIYKKGTAGASRSARSAAVASAPKVAGVAGTVGLAGPAMSSLGTAGRTG
jgi:hypothetical protein